MAGPPIMGGANPQNLRAMIEAGLVPPQGGPPQGGPPQGMPPQGMPPGGPPQGMPPGGPPGGGMPPMSQSEFGNGRPMSPDAKARQTMMLEEILRRRAAEMQGMDGMQGAGPMQ